MPNVVDPGQTVIYINEPRVDLHRADGKRLAVVTPRGVRAVAAPVAPRRTGHRGKPAARPAARRVKSTRGSPDDDPGEPEPPRPECPVEGWLWDLLVAHKPGAVR